MKFEIVTIFPDFFKTPLNTSILKKAQESELVYFNCYDIRDYSNNKHNAVDDSPYGGGAGMVMMAPPIVEAVESINKENQSKTILLTPRGIPFNQAKALELAKLNQLIIICGRYEGIDERVSNLVVDEEISIGDYVINGGETAALVLIEAITRLIPGTLGNNASATNDTFQNNLLEYPQYTRPETYRNLTVPTVLLSGNHSKIDEWRELKSKEITNKNRPDLLKKKTK